jgi:hypothetical protein
MRGDASRGKSGQRRERQLLTATGGNPRESATETKPLSSESKGEKSEVRARSLCW